MRVPGSSRAWARPAADLIQLFLGVALAGTMFWVRSQALEPLRGLSLAARAFAPEAGASCGAMEHAVDGLFNHSVQLAGFDVVGVSAE